MQCAACNHELSLNNKRNIMAVYPQGDKIDIVCMFLGQSQGNDPQGNPICVVLPGWRTEQTGLDFHVNTTEFYDKDAQEAFDAASQICPIDVLFMNGGAGPKNFQYLTSLIKAARKVHPKMCIFSAAADKKLGVRYRGDETEVEKVDIFMIGQCLVRDLAIAVKASD